MTCCSRITRNAILGAALLGMLQCAAAAEPGKAYKYVDENGNVVYSQTPPPKGAGVKKLDLQPAYRGLGGYGTPVSPTNETRDYYEEYRRDRYGKVLQQRRQQMDDATSKRRAELEAECNRNRGTDCSDPEALRYLESTKVPGGRRY